eukprot:TRINITY_DN15727_c0_g1_i1.p1 TRINITY_DN15727_c0_g1~~TRINITY_DN15727_c0_g1_i1.p1  ORF type:complete len:1063 (-),score=88.65 TRINITY_DN15727_c0_g1_i1:45-3233(-)
MRAAAVLLILACWLALASAARCQSGAGVRYFVTGDLLSGQTSSKPHISKTECRWPSSNPSTTMPSTCSQFSRDCSAAANQGDQAACTAWTSSGTVDCSADATYSSAKSCWDATTVVSGPDSSLDYSLTDDGTRKYYMIFALDVSGATWDRCDQIGQTSAPVGAIVQYFSVGYLMTGATASKPAIGRIQCTWPSTFPASTPPSTCPSWTRDCSAAANSGDDSSCGSWVSAGTVSCAPSASYSGTCWYAATVVFGPTVSGMYSLSADGNRNHYVIFTQSGSSWFMANQGTGAGFCDVLTFQCGTNYALRAGEVSGPAGCQQSFCDLATLTRGCCRPLCSSSYVSDVGACPARQVLANSSYCAAYSCALSDQNTCCVDDPDANTTTSVTYTNTSVTSTLTNTTPTTTLTNTTISTTLTHTSTTATFTNTSTTATWTNTSSSTSMTNTTSTTTVSNTSTTSSSVTFTNTSTTPTWTNTSSSTSLTNTTSTVTLSNTSTTSSSVTGTNTSTTSTLTTSTLTNTTISNTKSSTTNTSTTTVSASSTSTTSSSTSTTATSSTTSTVVTTTSTTLTNTSTSFTVTSSTSTSMTSTSTSITITSTTSTTTTTTTTLLLCRAGMFRATLPVGESAQANITGTGPFLKVRGAGTHGVDGIYEQSPHHPDYYAKLPLASEQQVAVWPSGSVYYIQWEPGPRLVLGQRWVLFGGPIPAGYPAPSARWEHFVPDHVPGSTREEPLYEKPSQDSYLGCRSTGGSGGQWSVAVSGLPPAPQVDSFAPENSIVVSGAGTAAANGIYSRDMSAVVPRGFPARKTLAEAFQKILRTTAGSRPTSSTATKAPGSLSVGTTQRPRTVACLECPPGAYSQGNATECLRCPGGSYSLGGADICTECLPGRFAASAGDQLVTRRKAGPTCGRDAVAVGRGTCTYVAPTATGCQPCQAGWYSGRGAAECLPCPPGTAVAPSSAHCSTCPNGTWSGPGATTCARCPAGRSGIAEGLASPLACEQCPPGRFASRPGSTTCSDCPAKTFAAALGQTSCQACASGSSSQAGASLCYLCPQILGSASRLETC